MILDYRWDPAMRLWVVIDTHTNQTISIHWSADEAINFIKHFEVERDQVA